MLAKLAWRLFNRPDCLLAHTLLGKYCHSNSFRSVSCPTSSSHGRKSILAGRDLLVRHLGKAISNGETTKVWGDSWLSTTEHLAICGPPNETDRDLVVADLMLRGSARWNESNVESILPTVAHFIYQIFPSSLNAEDKFCWQRTKSGIYSVRSEYYSMIECTEATTNQIVTNREFNWHKNIWAVETTPKLRLFLWKLAQGALPLGANLQTRGLTTNTNCPHCNAPETAIHLILHCPFAQQVWELAPISPTTKFFNSVSIYQILTMAPALVCLPRTGITAYLFSWIGWNLWTSRNRLVFENRRTSPDAVITNAISNAREWKQVQQTPDLRTRCRQRPSSPHPYP